MRLFIYIFILSITLLTSTYAQVAGYRGKRVNLKLNVSGMPLTGYLLADEKAYDFNPRLSAGLDVVVANSLVIGISAEQTNDIIYLKKYSANPDFNSSSSRPVQYSSAANYYGISYGMNLKFFSFNSSGSIAPFGRFVVMEYLYNDIKVIDDGRFYSSGKTHLGSIQSHTILLGIGSQKVFLNRFTLEGNVKIGLNTYGWGSSFKLEERQLYDEVYKATTYKMLSDYLISVGVGIGFLAF